MFGKGLLGIIDMSLILFNYKWHLERMDDILHG